MNTKTKPGVEFRLFALLLTTENINYAEAFRFCRINQDYILIYAQRSRMTPPVGKAAKLGPAEVRMLPEAAKWWLIGCAAQMLTEAIDRDDATVAQRYSELLANLEKELEAEAAKKEVTDGGSN